MPLDDIPSTTHTALAAPFVRMFVDDSSRAPANNTPPDFPYFLARYFGAFLHNKMADLRKNGDLPRYCLSRSTCRMGALHKNHCDIFVETAKLRPVRVFSRTRLGNTNYFQSNSIPASA